MTTLHADDASDKTEYDTYLDDDDDDPMAQLRKNPTVRNLVTVTFTRDEFLKRLDTDGLAIRPPHTACSTPKWTWTAKARSNPSMRLRPS